MKPELEVLEKIFYRIESETAKAASSISSSLGRSSIELKESPHKRVGEVAVMGEDLL